MCYSNVHSLIAFAVDHLADGSISTFELHF